MIRRPDHRSAAAALAARLIVGSLLILLGCAGGSGSSGFDLAENGAIMQALDEERCVESDGLTICPADGASPTATPTETATQDSNAFTPTSPSAEGSPTPTPPAAGTVTPSPPIDNPSATATPVEGDQTPTPTESTLPHTPTRTRTPTPTPTPTLAAPGEMKVDTSIGENRGVDCTPGTGSCSFLFHFSPQGFTPDTAFQVAARLRDPDGEWLLFPAEEVSLDPGMPVYQALLALPLAGRQEGDLVAQVAVLAFSTPPGAQSPALDSLGASGANFAFVTSELLVMLDRSGAVIGDRLSVIGSQ
jgi:hypothetical protein